MSTTVEKATHSKSPAINQAARQLSHSYAPAPQPDLRPAAAVQRQAQQAIDSSLRVQQSATLQRALNSRAQATGPAAPAQRQEAPAPVRENNTGLPDELKAGVENLSGHSLDDVRVHYNSAQPAELQAHAYAQGTDIHVAPGQEQHLPHEAWHVAQQKQGRVKPTRQLKGKVPVNDDAGLEKEADVMGQQALAAPAATTQRRLVRATGTAAVQRVRNESKRGQLDTRMDGLKVEAVRLLQKMRAEGQNWEKAYAAKGKAKGSGILDGKKTDYPAEARKALLKEGWKNLTREQKTDLLLEAGKLTGRVIGTTARGVGKAAGLLPSSRGGDEETESRKPKPRERREEPQASEPSESLLDSLTLEELQIVYRSYSLLNKGLKKYGEAKDVVRKKAGEIGESVGAEVGKVRDEWDFNGRMDDLRQDFMAARRGYELLKEAIEENEDSARYAPELEALYNGLMNSLHGPAMVYRLELDETGRRQLPQVCQNALSAIERSSRVISLSDRLSSAVSRGVRAIVDLADGGDGERERVATAQTELATALTNVLNGAWASRTVWRSIPTTVGAIKRALPTQTTASAKLTEAVKLAAAAQGQKSSNRSADTQLLYQTLAGLKVDRVDSLQSATTVLEDISRRLG